MNFSEGIKYIRKVAYLSQESFAKEIGVSFSTVNRWERGKSKPNYAAMKKINDFTVSINMFHQTYFFNILENYYISFN